MSILNGFRLDGNVALVTGAGKGIGEGIALGMAEAGADLALVARTRADLDRVAAQIQAGGRRALAVPADVAALPGIVDRVVATYGQIDVLVNRAGMQRRMTVLEATVDGWEQVINTNLRSAYFLTQAVGKVMVAQRRGKVINIASMTAYRGFHMISLG